MSLNVKTVNAKQRRGQCSFCSKFYSSKTIHKHVKNNHSKENEYPCYICKKVFLDICQRNRHKQQFHSKQPQLPELPCSICKDVFDDVWKLKEHMVLKHRNHDHQCLFCKDAFDKEYKLKRHLILKHHHPEHRCFICKDVFQNQLKLDEHIVLKHPIQELLFFL